MPSLKNLDVRANLLAIFALILFVAVAAASNQSEYVKAKITERSSTDITISGGCDKEVSPHFVNKIELASKITYCDSGDADVYTIEISEFQSSGEFVIYTAGYFSDNVKLIFEVDGQVVHPLKEISYDPGETWTAQKILLPGGEDKRVNISLIDSGSSFKEWGGLSIPTSDYRLHHTVNQIQAILWLMVFFVISVAITYSSYVYLRKFTQLEAIIAPSVFILLCCIYYFSFWIYYLSHSLGLLFSYVLLSISIFILFKSLFKGAYFCAVKSSYVLKIYLLPVLYVIVLFSFSIAYGDLTSIQKTAATIFTHELPIDNFLPKIFSDQVYKESLANPMIGDWLSSDRPPLQTGQFLFFYKLFSGAEIGYQLTAMLLQAYCLVPLILLINIFIKGNTFLKFLIFYSLAFSSVVLVNTMYVWPKLIAGAALLFVIYVLLNVAIFKSKLTPIILATTLAMIAMLAHTGSFFSLVPIAIISLFVFRPNLRDIIAALAVSIIMFGPWIFYQKQLYPPGDRLTKWHLAGQVAINDISVMDSIKSAYSSAETEEVIAAKTANVRRMFEGVLSYDYISAPVKLLSPGNSGESSIHHVKTKLFFGFFYSMGIIFIVGIFSGVVLLAIKRRNFFKLPLALFFVAPVVSLCLWCLLMFEAGSTVIHQGPYFPWLALLFSFSVLIFYLFRKYSAVFFIVQLIASTTVYFLSVIAYQDIANILMLPICLISFVVFIFLSFKFIGCDHVQQPIRNLYAK